MSEIAQAKQQMLSAGVVMANPDRFALRVSKNIFLFLSLFVPQRLCGKLQASHRIKVQETSRV